jgi:GPH family glycoside/pentoside/hexuronide:cation symporter
LRQSANSFGCKIGSGLGSAVVLWVLAFCGYAAGAETQPVAAMNSFIALYWWVPAVLSAVLFILASRWDIEQKIEEMEGKPNGD